MKKFFLLATAMFAAFTINAKEIVVDLNTAVAELSSSADAVTFSLNEGVLTVNWTAAGGWQNQGVAFPVNDLTNVTNISYEFKGDGVSAYLPDGVCLYPYLRDDQGKRWYKSSLYPNLKNTEWQEISILPDNCPWDGATYDFGEHPFTSFAVVANPNAAGSGTFYIRNLKITADEATGIDNAAVDVKATKIIRDGQVMIVRDGKTFNALGAEVK